MGLFEDVSEKAEPLGLNLIAAIPAEHYDAVAASQYRANTIYPGCRSIMLIGNGGGEFWRSFRAYASQNSGWLERENPLDDYTREMVEARIAAPLRSAGVSYHAVYPFASGAPTLNFMQLGTLAGLAGPSIIGVVVHPRFGPWIAFRAALLLETELDCRGEAAGFDPCPTCSTRSCISACPGAAVSFPSGWDIPRCLEHRVEAEPDCSERCHARVACVLGPAYRYPDDELAYHQMRAMRAMRPYYKNRGKDGA